MSAVRIPQAPPRSQSAIFISAIELTIAIMFGCFFGLISRELGD